MRILNWEAILWDCLEKIKEIPSESIDMIITSPPYDNLRTYGWNLQWDFEGITKELYRVTKEWWVCVWIVWDATVKWSETWTSFKQALYFKDIGFNLHDTMIWNKWNFTAVWALKLSYAPVFEYMFIFSKWKLKTFNPIKDRVNKSFWRKTHWTIRQKDWTTKPISKIGVAIPEYGQRHNIWECIPEKRNTHRLHPAMFPEKLITDHILSWSNEWDMILDPFAWSFTTAVACENTNRKWICIEKEQEYYDIWINRIISLP